MHIVDRRRNPGGKSLANRQRFIRRAKALLRRAVRDQSGARSIREVEQGGEVSIPLDGVREPAFRRAPGGGVQDHLLPGNKQYTQGEAIPRPKGGAGGGGSEGSPDGEGEDDFRFVLSREEFLDLFLEDLELPDLAKRALKDAEAQVWRRAGYSSSGSPSNMSLPRTMRNSLSRRVALRRPKPEEVARLREEAEALEASGGDPGRLAELRAELDLLARRGARIPFIDPLDVRYRRLESSPKPAAQAVMFCLMDVSGSMSEHMKDLAKRFFALLYIFLGRRYAHVDVVFIRHTHQAQEVDEEVFFHGAETGGTIVSTALEEMRRVVAQRYDPADWNIYAAQASDGDNSSSDNPRTAALLTEAILPLCQYYAYLEVGPGEDEPNPIGFINRDTDLWRTYGALLRGAGADAPMVMRKVRHRREIYPVFRELFESKSFERRSSERKSGAET